MQPNLRSCWLGLALLMAGPSVASQEVVTEDQRLSVDVSRNDGRITMDLFGSIWLLPPNGGAALKLTDTTLPATRPRWSPDGRQILYQTNGVNSQQLWLLEVATGHNTALGKPTRYYQQAAWHPDGERIVFSSWRSNSGLDIWELDLHTGVEWRLTSLPGDELEPAWSEDGRDLVYVRHEDDLWALVLRRFGEQDIDLLVSETPLASPSWRPDGTLITFFKNIDDRYQLQMAILSDPVLVRPLAGGEDYFPAPVSWLDRSRLYYTANGRIKTREFGEWRSHRINFRATIGEPAPRPQLTMANRELPLLTPPAGKLVIRAARLFDGVSRRYQEKMDVLINGGLIESVVPRQDWGDVTVLDLGTSTLLPGFIDAYSASPEGPVGRSGPELLSYGVTTLVAVVDESFDTAVWETERTPGPRVLRAATLGAMSGKNTGETDDPVFLIAATDSATGGADERESVQHWQDLGTPVLAENPVVGRSIGAGLLLAANTISPASPGDHFAGRRNVSAGEPIALVSALGGAGTPGLQTLYRSRQAWRYRDQGRNVRRLTSVAKFDAGLATVVLGSKPNGMPPGLALHAELRALAAAGLSGDQVLKATGQNAARVLGLAGKIGQITPGARADMVLVNGDPLLNVSTALDIIAVVRNGRFFSLVSLLERARTNSTVE